MLTYDAERATKLTGTSASDCEISIMNGAETHPVETLVEVANALHHLNLKGWERKSHRQALVKAGRKALKKLESM
ncbi:hypothetical protein ACJO2E_02645 [Marinobacter sp. M1N3S26]|uniref:hypothetical protein n=1 Tax=Marinobacter sp. M1N3S26 TaxID=3382299 RepID=UPI00387AEA1F